jgi:hypothetical protein
VDAQGIILGVLDWRLHREIGFPNGAAPQVMDAGGTSLVTLVSLASRATKYQLAVQCVPFRPTRITGPPPGILFSFADWHVAGR